MSNYKPISDEHKKEIDFLNAAIEKAINDRTQWLDAHMEEYADYPIGEMLYDSQYGNAVGTVVKIWRRYGPNSGCRKPYEDRSVYSYFTLSNGEHSSNRKGALMSKAEIEAGEEVIAARVALRKAKAHSSAPEFVPLGSEVEHDALEHLK